MQNSIQAGKSIEKYHFRSSNDRKANKVQSLKKRHKATPGHLLGNSHILPIRPPHQNQNESLTIMKKNEHGINEPQLFVLLAVLGTAVIFFNVKIPHTEVIIDGRWAVGFIGFVLLRKRLALLLTCLLSIPYFSDVPFYVGFFGNLLYAVPIFIVIRIIHSRILSGLHNGHYALGWIVLVLACYQLFTTPAVWAVIASLQDIPIWSNVIDGWRAQPFLIESFLVAIVSASVMFAFRSYTHVNKSRQELEITLNSIGDAVISTNIDGMITKMNPVAENLRCITA